MTSLLKSLSSVSVSFSAFFHAPSAKNVSTVMPSTLAEPSRSDALSRKVHISAVHVPLNAAGMNARTTGPFFNSSLSVTGSRSSFIRVKSGALAPTSAAIRLSLPGHAPVDVQ